MSNPLLRSERLSRLRRRESQIKAQLQDAVARQNCINRRKDTRRKILVGAFFHRKYVFDGNGNQLIKMMDSYLVRPGDRLLFGLPAICDQQIDPSMLNTDLQLPLRGIILIGAFFLDQYSAGKMDELSKMMNPFLRRAADRRLFGLGVLKNDNPVKRVDDNSTIPF